MKPTSETETETEIAIIIVNYNTAELALRAIESVLAHSHGGRTTEIHLVDNASPDGDGAILADEIVARGWEPQVTLHQEGVNLGFGHGNNVVLQQLVSRPTPPQYVFLLNPDARLENEAIAILSGFLDIHPSAAAAGARIEKPDGTPVTAAFRFPGIISTFSAALSFGPVSRLLAHWQVPIPPDTPTAPVDWVSGAAVMLRISALQRTGFFDPAFFLYFEETDLMLRLARQGGQIWHVHEAQVIHVEGAATDVQSGRAERRRLPAYWYVSWQYYFRKNHGRTVAIVAVLVWLLGAVLNRLISALRGKQPSAPRRFYRDFWANAVSTLLGLKATSHE